MSDRKRGFTLAEVLVVISIIGVIAAITMSVFGGAKSRALGTVSVSNMRQIGTALLLYTENHGGYLPPLSNYELEIWWIEHWPQGTDPMQLPTNSDMPDRIRAAIEPYIHNDEVWYSPLDPVRRQDIFYLGIRHQVTSYGFDFIDWSDIDGRRPDNFPARSVAMSFSYNGLIDEPAGPGDWTYNEPSKMWQGPCRSYYDGGSSHFIANDLHMVRFNCNARTREGESTRVP